jgi:hypothetical protein
MRKSVIRGKVPKVRVRLGVFPTRVEKDRTKYTRKTKHRPADREGCGKPFVFQSLPASWRRV